MEGRGRVRQFVLCRAYCRSQVRHKRFLSRERYCAMRARGLQANAFTTQRDSVARRVTKSARSLSSLLKHCLAMLF